MTPSLAVLAPLIPPDLKVLSLDPGQTTGYSYWCGLKRTELGQFRFDNFESWINSSFFGPIDQFVVENYRVYGGKKNVQGDLFTPRLLGQIEAYAEYHRIPIVLQMAAVAKRFCTDQKLKDWDLWVSGKPHAMDATRHGAFWLCFESKRRSKE